MLIIPVFAMPVYQLVEAGIHDIDFTMIGSNTLQDQNFLDQYVENFGTGPLASFKQESNFVFLDRTDSLIMLDARNAYYPKVKTNTVGVGLTFRHKLAQTGILGFSGAVDYTNFDALNFYQGVFSTEYLHTDYAFTGNAYIPVGNSQSFGSSLDAVYVGLFGLDLTLSHKIKDFTLGISGAIFSHDDIKEKQSTVALQAAYNYGNSLELGGDYQLMYGQDTADSGFKVYAKMPLFKSSSTNNNMSMPSHVIKRQLGSTIAGKEQSCGEGIEGFSYHGVHNCESVVTNDSFELTNLNNGLNQTAGVNLSTNVNYQCSSTPLTISNSSVYHLRRPHCHHSITIEPGALIIYSPGGMLISKATNTVIGTTGDNLKVTFYPLDQLKSDASGTNSFGFLNKLKRGPSSVPNSIPLVLYDDSFMDFNADDDTAVYTAEEMPIFAGELKSTKSTAAASRNSTLTIATGILKDATIGGSGDAATLTNSIYPAAQINNVNFAYSGLTSLGANVSLNDVNFYGGYQQLTAVGGHIESTNCSHIATSTTNRVIQLRGAAQYFGFGNNYDQSQAALAGYKGIEVKDAHVATAADKMPQLIVGQSLFTMGDATGEAVSKTDMLSISAMNDTTVAGNLGMTLYLFQSIIDLRAATADLTDNSIRFADIDYAVAAKYGTNSDAVLDSSVMLAGLTFNGNGASAASLIKYGVGLGNTTAAGDGTNYGSGSGNFPLAIASESLGIMSADFITSTLSAPSIADSDTDAEMATSYTSFYKPLAANKITYYTAATIPSGTFYTHLQGMPKETSATTDLSLLSHIAYTSQLTASTTLLPATANTASTDIFRLATSKAAFTTGANTLTGYEMFKFAQLLTEEITPSVNSTLTKLKTKA